MILIIGYGNPLRGDDAIGQHIAWALEGWRPDVQIITVYQLTPELVEPVARAQCVIFIDARAGDTPGQLTAEPVEPDSSAGAFTHHVSPASLLAGAQFLYRRAPAGLLISITGYAFDYGGDLSPSMHNLMPALLNQVRRTIHAFISDRPRPHWNQESASAGKS